MYPTLESQFTPSLESSAATAARMAAFRSSYPAANGRDTVAANFQNADREISARFAEIGASAAQSRAQTAAQIAELKRNRTALYNSIVAQIKRTVAKFAQQRHISIALTVAPTHGGTDFTNAIRAELTKL